MATRRTSQTETKKRDVRDELADLLIEMIDNGETLPWHKTWNPDSGLPINAVTGKPYRGHNEIWLSILQPANSDDTRWCTFKQAQSQGWKIRKGAKGVPVEKWMVWTPGEKTSKADRGLTEDGKESVITSSESRLICRVYYVFHATNVEGIPELVSRSQKVGDGEGQEDLNTTDPRVQEIVAGMKVKLEERGNRAYYTPYDDTIVVPRPEEFISPAAYDATLLHEIGHATGAKTRLDRNLSVGYLKGGEEYAKEELRAEISASMTAKLLGIIFDPTETSQLEASEGDLITNSAAYLKSWLTAIPENKRKGEITAAISAAKRISDYTLKFVKSLDLDKENEEAESTGIDGTLSGSEIDTPDPVDNVIPFTPVSVDNDESMETVYAQKQNVRKMHF